MSLVNGFAEGALVKLTQLLLQITHGTHVGESVCVCVWLVRTDGQYGPGSSRPSGCGVHLDRRAHVGL